MQICWRRRVLENACQFGRVKTRRPSIRRAIAWKGGPPRGAYDDHVWESLGEVPKNLQKSATTIAFRAVPLAHLAYTGAHMERDLCHQRHASPRFVAERGTRVQEAAARRELHAEKWEGFQQARPQAFRCHGCRCPDPERADSINKVPA